MKLRLFQLGALCALAGGVILHPATALAVATPQPFAAAGVLTLEEAISRTLARGAELVIAAEDVRAAEAEAVLAGRLPSPELTVSLENVAGDDFYSGTDAAELTIELSQPLELGGKRQLRRDAAELGRQLAANNQGLARTDALAATRQRFITVLAAQERLTLAREQAELAAKSLAAADERIKAGKAPAIDRLRLKGEAGQAALTVAQAERTLLTARQALATGWGDAQPDFERVAGDLALLPGVPAAATVDASMERSAAALNRRLATHLKNIELEQARAARVPDPSLTVGWRQFEESNESAWVFGISVPLPLFTQGQEAVVAASSRYHGAKAREISEHNQARAALRGAWQALADARAEAEVLSEQVVPAATEGFAAAEFGYRAGKFGLLELLDAQRTLFAARQQQLVARTGCHLAAIELERLQATAAADSQQLPTP